MKLYSYINCPFAQRARISLNISEINYQIIEVDLNKKPRELLKYNPKGTVPVLVQDNKSVISESIEIVKFACKTNLEKWQDISQETQQQFINEFNQEFFSAAKELKLDPHNELAMAKADEYLLYLDTILSKNSYIHGEKISVDDVISLPFIRNFVTNANSEQKNRYTHVAQWLDNIMAMPAYLKAMEYTANK
jgi:glutathione S-transferase